MWGQFWSSSTDYLGRILPRSYFLWQQIIPISPECQVIAFEFMVDTFFCIQNVRLLSQFVSPYTGRIYGRAVTGLCIPMQKQVAKAIKRSQKAGRKSLLPANQSLLVCLYKSTVGYSGTTLLRRPQKSRKSGLNLHQTLWVRNHPCFHAHVQNSLNFHTTCMNLHDTVN